MTDSDLLATSRFPRSSPYWPVLSHGLLRRLLPGFALSSIGDGMSIVAVSWLALQLAPDAHRGVWVAIAVAAYTLPSAVTAIVLGPFLSRRSGAQLAGWDALLRAVALGAIPVAHLLGGLTIGIYVALLGISSLLHSWGSAGRFTLIAEVLPQRHHLAANATLGTISELATITGPPLAGFLISAGGAVLVLGLDALTFAVLAISYRFVASSVGPSAPDRSAEPARYSGFGVIRHNRTLLGLFVLSFGFFFLFGPVYVALPVQVSTDLHGSAAVLGWFYAAFGVGSVMGGLSAGYLRRWSLWPTTIGIVIAFGLAMLPLGLDTSTVVAGISFGVAGFIWAPYFSTIMVLFQSTVPLAQLPQVLAANSAISVLAVPLGTALGGPLVALLGPRETLLTCAIATVVLGLLAACLRLTGRRYGIRTCGLAGSIPSFTRRMLDSADRK